MKLQSLKVLGVAALTATFLTSCNQDSEIQNQEVEMIAPSSSQVIPGQYIVVYNSDFTRSMENGKMSYEKAQENMKSQTMKLMSDANIKGAVLNVYSKALSGASVKLSPEGADMLRKRKEVAYIEEDRIVMQAPGGKGKPSGGGGSSAQETPYGITRVGGAVDYSAGPNVAWILDTGIDLDHEDLNVNVTKGFNAFTSGKDGRSLDDGNGHGTHVAGTIGALDNNVGVVGVAAGAKVVPVKVLDSRGSGSYSGVI
ncbi:MAG: S8 family serine peptidase, partial [Gramella sp.]|nr:S8 family serine peptidase [Christiangramia sp.]